MIETFKNWVKARFPADEPSAPLQRRTTPLPRPRPVKKAPPSNSRPASDDEDLSGTIESIGPGKNVLVRNKYLREDTGTHETLKILDDSVGDNSDEDGIDPYNTGGFDRSKNWDTRFRK